MWAQVKGSEDEADSDRDTDTDRTINNPEAVLVIIIQRSPRWRRDASKRNVHNYSAQLCAGQIIQHLSYCSPVGHFWNIVTPEDTVMEIWKYKRLEHQICLCVF